MMNDYREVLKIVMDFAKMVVVAAIISILIMIFI